MKNLDKTVPGGENSGNVADSAGTTERDLLAVFVGPNAERFQALYDASKPRRGMMTALRSGGNWAAGFFALPWLFYRKLYIEGAALFLIAAAIAYFLPEHAIKILSLSIVAMMKVANPYYLRHALRKIGQIERLALPEGQRKARIKAAGGVSELGGYIGAIAYAGAILIIVEWDNPRWLPDAPPKELPACDAPGIPETVRRAMPGDRELPATLFYDFRAAGTPTDSIRPCRFSIRTSRGPFNWRFIIHWRDSRRSRAVLSLQGPLGQ